MITGGGFIAIFTSFSLSFGLHLSEIFNLHHLDQISLYSIGIVTRFLRQFIIFFRRVCHVATLSSNGSNSDFTRLFLEGLLDGSVALVSLSFLLLIYQDSFNLLLVFILSLFDFILI